MVSPFLIQAGFPVLLTILSEALTRVNHPAARVASQSLGNVTDALGRGQISRADMEEANRHAEAIAALRAEENKTAYQQINESLRAEIASEDPYIRRMRPTFGYLMAASWAVQMVAVAYIMVFRVDDLPSVLMAMDSLVALWAMGLSVLGIYVYKRSEEKKSVFQGFGLPILQEKVIGEVRTPKPVRTQNQFNE